ncbi:hypothetical protein SCLCIDRAFT_116668, partial [Scleroderma citrinum Foug A]
YLLEWLPHKARYLSVLLSMEAPPESRICMQCGRDGIFRCTECAHSPIFCSNCCLDAHELNPFHRIQRWTGTFFEDFSVRLISLVIHLGHGGKPCPMGGYNQRDNGSDEEEDWEDVEDDDRLPHLARLRDRGCLTVVHTNGVHFCDIWYCTCEASEDSHVQLMMAGLFPATTKSPRTAFSFQVLDDFIRDNVECGTTAMNYYSKLQRLTSNGFLHAVPDRYRELLRVSRAWQLLKLLKWKGFDGRSEEPEPGELVLFCPACPQPGVNVPPTEEADLTNWKYSRIIAMDGNFKAEHMLLKRNTNEVWLMDGKGFMVTEQPYKRYLAGTANQVEKLDCSNHRAVNQANSNRSQLASTGIGGCSCARHGCFIPHAMVNFQRGEQQVNMDYALVHAVQHGMQHEQKVINFYDINCQYSKNLYSWINRNQFISLPPGIQPGIGIWHVHGHQTQCFVRYAPNFIPGAGNVDGEIMETLWSSLNIISPSTRGMVAPHRQEILDFQMNDSNFLKMVHMRKFGSPSHMG